MNYKTKLRYTEKKLKGIFGFRKMKVYDSWEDKWVDYDSLRYLEKAEVDLGRPMFDYSNVNKED